MVENMDDGVYLLLIIQKSVEGISLYLSCSSKGSEAERSPIAFPFCCFQLINLQRHLKQPFHSLGAGFLQDVSDFKGRLRVLGRPHGSNAASRDWSMGPHEPYWRTNTSFSPPPSRWDFRFQSESLPYPYGLRDDRLYYDSSTSSNSKESRSWVRVSRRYSQSDGPGPYFSSPSEISQAQQWTPPTIQGMNVADYETTARRDAVPGRLSFTPTMEETSAIPDSAGSTSSRSDGSDYDPTPKAPYSSHRHISNRRCFMSKPIHPLSFPTRASRETYFATTPSPFSEIEASITLTDSHGYSDISGSIDYGDISENFESENHIQSSAATETFKCGLCDRFLSQRSPWSSRRIVKSGDMPITGVLSCRHVFHADCLDQTTPKTRKNDPPCPLCVKPEEENLNLPFTKLRIGLPRLRPFSEDGSSSRHWGCTQVGDCVEGALHAPSKNTLLLLNRNRMKKNLSLKGKSTKEITDKIRKSGSYSSQLFSGRLVEGGVIGCSKTGAGPSMRS